MKLSPYLLPLLATLAGACSDGGAQTNSQDTEGGSGSTSVTSTSTTTSTTTTTTTSTTSVPTTGPEATTCEAHNCGCSQLHKPSVMLVLDRSGSMVADPEGLWDHDQDPNTPVVTRWSSLHSATADFAVLTDPTLALGLVLFPAAKASSSLDETACIVDASAAVTPAAMNATSIIGALPDPSADATTMAGATPANKGLTVALEALASVPAEEPRFLILVTDGVANCQADAPDAAALLEVADDGVMATVTAAAAAGTRTVVVGIDIANAVSSAEVDGFPDNVNTYDLLNALAIAGGAARPGDEKFFNVTDQVGLSAAFEVIARQLSCTFALDPTPKYLDQVSIEPYGRAHVDDCAAEDGWMFLPKLDPADPEEPLTIALCGAACSNYLMTGALEIIYLCPPG